jgi:hypothetical protein
MAIIRLSLIDIKHYDNSLYSAAVKELSRQTGTKLDFYQLFNRRIDHIHWASSNNPHYFLSNSSKYTFISSSPGKINPFYEVNQVLDFSPFGEVNVEQVHFGKLCKEDIFIYTLRCIDKDSLYYKKAFYLTEKSLKILSKKRAGYDAEYKGKATMETIRIKTKDA